MRTMSLTVLSGLKTVSSLHADIERITASGATIQTVTYNKYAPVCSVATFLVLHLNSSVKPPYKVYLYTEGAY